MTCLHLAPGHAPTATLGACPPRPRARRKRPAVLSSGAMIVLVVAALLAHTRSAHAHGIGMSQLRFQVDGSRVETAWEVDLRDARLAVQRDPQVSGEEGWRDLRDEEGPLQGYLARGLTMTADSRACEAKPAGTPMQWDREQNQVILREVFTCGSPPAQLLLTCGLLFDSQQSHRVYFSLQDDRITHLGIFREGQRTTTIDVHYFHLAAGFLEFAHEGVAHIWTGFDHLLFLLTLLLPAPLARRAGAWSLRAGLGQTARESLKVVTSFTLAHSLTLGLCFFGLVMLPARWVESGIALSVFAAAWNNIRPFLPGRAWAMALAFGLLHGLGFAGALRNLSLPTHARGLALLGFNVGVEVGQLALVALVLPILYVASRRREYPRLVMGLGSLGVAWLAAVWAIERAFGVSLLPTI